MTFAVGDSVIFQTPQGQHHYGVIVNAIVSKDYYDIQETDAFLDAKGYGVISMVPEKVIQLYDPYNMGDIHPKPKQTNDPYDAWDRAMKGL